MAENKVYKMVEVVGTSAESFAKAAAVGVEKASETVRHIDWFEVVDMRGRVENGKIAQYQVTMKLGFRVE